MEDTEYDLDFELKRVRRIRKMQDNETISTLWDLGSEVREIISKYTLEQLDAMADSYDSLERTYAVLVEFYNKKTWKPAGKYKVHCTDKEDAIACLYDKVNDKFTNVIKIGEYSYLCNNRSENDDCFYIITLQKINKEEKNNEQD